MLIEVIFLLILVAFVLSGYRKGLLMSLCSLLVLVLCSLGASVAQSVFTTKAVEFMEPRVQQAVEAQLQEQVRQDSQQAVENAGETGITIGGQNITLGDLVDLLDRFGLDVEQQVTEGTSNAMEPVLTEAAWAVARAIVEPMAGLVIYLVAFVILYLVLHSVALAVNVVDRLPVIHTLNRLGGAVLGFLSGMLLLTVLSVVCRQTGWLSEDTAASGPLGMLFGKLVAWLT